MSILEIVQKLDVLITPIKEGTCLTIEEALLNKLKLSPTDNKLEHLKFLEKSVCQKNPFQNEQWWKFLCTLMETMLELKCAFLSADEKDSLISVKQLQTIKTCLQFIVSLGILAHLSPGVGISLQQRSPIYNQMLPKSNSLQKTYCLNVVLRCIMCLREEETLRKLLISTYIGDCLASIFELLMDTESLKADPANKDYLQSLLSCFLEETSQPVLFRELMFLSGNKNCPKKLARALRLMMVERIQKQNGVIAICRAILDVAGDQHSPKQWKTLSVIAKLIATPHQNENQLYRDNVYPQILKLLSTSELEFAQIAVLCVCTINETEPDVCQKYFIEKLCSPLIHESSEDKLNSCVESLYNCIAIPSTEHLGLAPSLFKQIYVPLFRLFCFVTNSASHIKSKLKRIVISILYKDMDYEGFVFGSVKLKFNYGEHGGVFSEVISEEMVTPWEDATDILLDLMEDDDLKLKLFKAVIPSLESTLEKRVVGAKILSELCSGDSVMKWIDEEPSGVVVLIRSLLENEYESEITCLGLMVLSIVLNNEFEVKKKDWSLFDSLVEPLKRFKSKSDNTELRVLADELYGMIVTRGVLKKEVASETLSSDLNKGRLGHYSQVIKNVTDPLVPVKAHALRELGKLIASHDPEALKNKEQIFLILKENIKCDDSYVYLSAVQALVCLAGMYPDEVLVTLTEQFVHCKVPETRLKVGEVLMRAIRILGEMAAVYKNEIINALLCGCRDSDHLVRASSLSSLGELCRIVSFRIHAFMIEIFECIRSIFETDKAMEPRRAAVMLLTLLLKGLGSDALTVLEPILLNLYRMLKFIYNHEKDDITRLHAQLAIEELNSSAVTFLCPQQDLKKHIFVLHPPT